MNNKVIIAFCLFAVLFFAANIAYAHDKHDKYINNEQTQIVSNQTQKGVALGIAAANHHFDLGTYETQISLAAGSYSGSEAVSIAIGKRVKDVLINGSIGREGGKTGIGIGVTFRF